MARKYKVVRYRYNAGGHISIKPSTDPSKRPTPQPPIPDPVNRDPLWMVALQRILGPLAKRL